MNAKTKALTAMLRALSGLTAEERATVLDVAETILSDAPAVDAEVGTHVSKGSARQRKWREHRQASRQASPVTPETSRVTSRVTLPETLPVTPETSRETDRNASRNVSRALSLSDSLDVSSTYSEQRESEIRLRNVPEATRETRYETLPETHSETRLVTAPETRYVTPPETPSRNIAAVPALGVVASLAADAEPDPEWLAKARMAGLQDPAAAWLKFRGHYTGKSDVRTRAGWGALFTDKWCTQERQYEARERGKRREMQLDAAVGEHQWKMPEEEKW